MEVVSEVRPSDRNHSVRTVIGEKKSSDLASRLNVKRGGKLVSKTPKAPSNPISSPPKAAFATSSSKKEEVHRRRNPLNDILRRRSRDGAEAGNDVSPLLRDVEIKKDLQFGGEDPGIDTKVADRVPELERALAIAKEEQASLSEELEEARQKSHEDEDTIDDLRQQLHDQRSREEEIFPLHTPDNVSGRLDDDSAPVINSLRYKIKHLESQLDQDAHHQARDEAEMNALRTRLHATEKELQERLQQLLSLKSSISSLTRSESQITDSELTESFSQLANRIREWVISNYRRSKFCASDVPSETVKILRSLTLAYESIESTDRLALYQAIVANALMQLFEEPVIVGLPKTGPLAMLRLFAEEIYAPITSDEYREWRRATIRMLATSGVKQTLQQAREDLLRQMARELEHVLFTLTAVNLTASAQSVLMGILNVAADLQRTLMLQKARYQVLFFRDPEPGSTRFDDHRMESIKDLDSAVDDDGDVLTERHFLFCVSPCLEKFGNEWGEDPEISNVLLKAMVCCGFG